MTGSIRTAVMLAGAGLLVVALDQLTKSVTSGADCGSRICPLRNDELMLGVGGRPALHLVVMSVVGLALFVVWAHFVLTRRFVAPIAIVLVVAGIVGNLLDRIAFGSVRDFLVVADAGVVNGADLAIAAGLIMCVVGAVRSLASVVPEEVS